MISYLEIAMVVCMKTGRVFGTYALLTQYCNRARQWFFSQYCIHLL